MWYRSGKRVWANRATLQVTLFALFGRNERICSSHPCDESLRDQPKGCPKLFQTILWTRVRSRLCRSLENASLRLINRKGLPYGQPFSIYMVGDKGLRNTSLYFAPSGPRWSAFRFVPDKSVEPCTLAALLLAKEQSLRLNKAKRATLQVTLFTLFGRNERICSSHPCDESLRDQPKGCPLICLEQIKTASASL